MTAARRLRDLWLAGSDPSAAGPSTTDGAAGDEPAADPASTPEVDSASTADVNSWRERSTCVPRQWFGPSRGGR